MGLRELILRLDSFLESEAVHSNSTDQAISWDGITRFFSNLVDFVEDIEIDRAKKDYLKAYLSSLPVRIYDEIIMSRDDENGVQIIVMRIDEKIQWFSIHTKPTWVGVGPNEVKTVTDLCHIFASLVSFVKLGDNSNLLGVTLARMLIRACFPSSIVE